MHRRHALAASVALGLLAASAQAAPDATSLPRIVIHADQVVHRISRHLTGACIEDVNHEVYGGIDSQMIFGESFAEPEPPPTLKGFTTYGGRWIPDADVLHAAAGDGPKLVLDGTVVSTGTVAVDVCFPQPQGGNAGLILKVDQPGPGADRFTGYEISLDTAGRLIVGRHRQNWEPIRTVPCAVPVGQWITLAVALSDNAFEVHVNHQALAHYTDTEHPLRPGAIGLRTWQRDARFRNLRLTTPDGEKTLPFARLDPDAWREGVSGMWRGFRHQSAVGCFGLETNNAFSGRQSQRVVFRSGRGVFGIENHGLNRQGMAFVPNRPYDGFVCVRAEAPIDVFVALESHDGRRVYAERRLRTRGGDWEKLPFELTPDTPDTTGRFAVKLKRPGAVTLGYAFLQPGLWGRFHGLPTRRDVAEALIDQGITVLRQGGCMANAAEYRWKNMIGPREQRPPYAGWWYPHASNGWGIFDFLNFCEAAGFLAIPNVNMGESPQDMADFVEYVNGPADSTWGRRRAADGHPAPYRLRHLQLGNEERVDENYWQKFKPLAEALWAKDPDLILVVGDFAYSQPIEDPFNFRGAAAGITTLAAQQQILHLAKLHNRELWFDVHIGTEGPQPDWGGTLSYLDALARLADGAKHRVVIFEFNAGNHAQRRALANAMAINAIERDGRIPIATSANCLQPDGQNDNGWDQGLLFLNPAQIWLQPPGQVTRMISRHYQPLLVQSEVHGSESLPDVTAKRSEDGGTLLLQVVNPTDHPVSTTLEIHGFTPRRPDAIVTQLAAPLDARNTAADPHRVVPVETAWRHGLPGTDPVFALPPHSFTILKFE